MRIDTLRILPGDESVMRSWTFSQERLRYETIAVQGALQADQAHGRGQILKRVMRSHHLWLFIGYMGILVLMARAYG